MVDEEHGLQALGGRARSGQCSRCRLSQDGLLTYCGYLCHDCSATYGRSPQNKETGVCDVCGAEGEVGFTILWLCPGCRLISPERNDAQRQDELERG
jgi:hypothetical protein